MSSKWLVRGSRKARGTTMPSLIPQRNQVVTVMMLAASAVIAMVLYFIEKDKL